MTHEPTPSETAKLGERYLTSDHVWFDLINTPSRYDRATPALFLDRDGVIVLDTSYVGNPDDVELLPGAAELINKANASHVPVIVVTNQSGIGRGYFGWSEFERVQDRISELLAEHDARVDAVLACAHHKDAQPPYRQDNHPYRKPNPGMIIAAGDTLNIDLANSWIVGDKAGDLEAGLKAGLRGGVHVATHPETAQTERERAETLESDQFQVITRADMKRVWDALVFLRPVY